MRWRRFGGATSSSRAKLWPAPRAIANAPDRKSTRLNSSHVAISYAVFCLKKTSDGLQLDDLDRSSPGNVGLYGATLQTAPSPCKLPSRRRSGGAKIKF